MKDSMLRILFGESLLIFCNVLTVWTEGEHTVIWDQPYPLNTISVKANATVLQNEEEYRDLLEIDEIKTFFFSHDREIETNISFIVSPCKSAEIHWTLGYTGERDAGDDALEDFPFEMLANGSSKEFQIFIGKARRGLYKLEIDSPSKIRFTYSVYVSLTPAVAQLLSEVNRKCITFKKNLTEGSLNITWPVWSSFKHKHPIRYVLSIAVNKFVNSACELEQYGLGYEYVATHNTSYLMGQQAMLGQTYHISVFLMYRNSFLLPYLRGKVTFPKSKPIGLKDGVRMKGTLTPHDSVDDTLTYRYKVKNHVYPSSNELHWLVIACEGNVYVEINHKKDAVVEKQAVNKYKIFTIKRPKKGNRYVMKIANLNGDQQRNFEVVATMRPDRFSLPNVENFTVTSIQDRSYKVRNRSRFLILWNAVTDNEPIEYCVYYIMKKPGDEERDENFGTVNQCSMRKYIKRIKEQHLEKPCQVVEPGKSPTCRRYLENLRSSRDYVVFVSARKPKKRRIWYNSVHISGRGSYGSYDDANE